MKLSPNAMRIIPQGNTLQRIFLSRFTFRLFSSLFIFITAFCNSSKAQCTDAPDLTFHSPVLINGTAGQPGAIYLFANVEPGVDCWVEILGLYGGATLFEIDDTTGVGYYDAFQPYVGAGAYDTSYIDWKFTFKEAGTNIDHILPCLAITGIDVDGDGSRLKEFIEAATPGSFSVDPATNLTIGFDGVRSIAISPVNNIPLIDTAHREAMFQMNFSGLSSLLYRNGAITTGGSQIRQTSIYFKSFFSAYTILPLKLLSFAGRSTSKSVDLNWSATGENNTRSYTVQRSEDANTWKDLSTLSARNLDGINQYFYSDFNPAITSSYYRLKQTDFSGNATYSKILSLHSLAGINTPDITLKNAVTNVMTLLVDAAETDTYQIEIYNLNGTRVSQQSSKIVMGANHIQVPLNGSLASGIYIFTVKNTRGQQVFTTKIFRSQV
jgi:hypothetical protein